MKHACRYLSLLLLCLMPVPPAPAQQIPQRATITSSPNPVGSGARAMGMGGAFIAVADDATAASWNPAGLTQLRKPEFSFALSHMRRREDFSSRAHPEAGGMQKTRMRDLNYMSFVWPFELCSRVMVVSINYQHLYDFDRNVSGEFIARQGDFRFAEEADFRQRGRLSTLSPAFAVKITPRLSLGLTLNIWTDKLFWRNGWESDAVVKGSTAFKRRISTRFTSIDRNRYYDFSGVNMHIGLLWRATGRLTLGAVIKTPFTATMEHERVVRVVTSNRRGRTGNEFRTDENVDLEMPLSYGIGAAVRLSDALSLSLDVFRTEWDHFVLEDGSGRRMSPVTGRPTHETRVDPTHQVRLGAEYLFIFKNTVVPLRCGLFYDPEPSEKSPEDFWGFSVGAGISLGPAVIDCAYRFRRGEDVEGEVLDIPSAEADVTQHLFMLSVIYHF